MLMEKPYFLKSGHHYILTSYQLIGGQPDIEAIEGAENHTIPVKPITKFSKIFRGVVEGRLTRKNCRDRRRRRWSELALAINKRWNEHGVTPRITLYSRSNRLLPQMSPRAAHLMLTALYDAGVKLQLGRAVKKIGETTLYFSPGTEKARGVKKGLKDG